MMTKLSQPRSTDLAHRIYGIIHESMHTIWKKTIIKLWCNDNEFTIYDLIKIDNNSINLQLFE